MRIWDRGTFELHKWRESEVMITFHGERLEGRYVLFRTGGKNWMIHRMDPPQDADREPMPSGIEPMLARTGTLPREDGRWAYEVKWDGVRAIGYAEGGRLRLLSRNANDITPRYPELRELGRALGSHEAVLDGEVVAFGPDGKPSFQRLQSRMHLASESAVRRLAASRARRLRDLRPALPRRPLADGAALRPSGASGCSRSGSTARTGRRRRTGRPTARRCWRPRGRRGWRGSSPSASTARTSRAAARRAG